MEGRGSVNLSSKLYTSLLLAAALANRTRMTYAAMSTSCLRCEWNHWPTKHTLAYDVQSWELVHRQTWADKKALSDIPWAPRSPRTCRRWASLQLWQAASPIEEPVDCAIWWVRSPPASVRISGCLPWVVPWASWGRSRAASPSARRLQHKRTTLIGSNKPIN